MTEIKSFYTPDELRPFVAHGQAKAVTVDGRVVLHARFKPGWRWSEDVKPIAGTDLCEVAHLVYVLAGEMSVEMKNGTRYVLKGGDVASIEPGHDAWNAGDGDCIAIDFGGGVSGYAKGEGE